MTTELDRLVHAAVLVEVERRRLTACRKVSAAGFVRDARLLAGEPDDARVAELKAKLEASRGLLPMLVRRLAVFITDNTCPCLPVHRDKLEKLFRINWLEGVDAEIADAGLTRWHVLLLAVLRATETHPDKFGSIADWAAHQDALAKATDKLNDLIAAMKVSFDARDVILSKPAPPPQPDLIRLNMHDKKAVDEFYRRRHQRELAARGAPDVGPWLARYPSISLADPHWPTKAIEQAMIGMPATDQPKEDDDARLAKKAKRAARDRASKSKSKPIKRKRPDPQVVGPLSAAHEL